MAVKLHKKHEVTADVRALALDRLRVCFDEFDTVAVSFSGGKDSTACLNLSLQVAQEKRRLPLDVFFFDEEAIPIETIEYVERVASRPDVRLQWIASPIKHRNAASNKSPWWYPWAKEDERLWCHPYPERGRYDEIFRGKSIPECNGILFGPDRGRVCIVAGIRTQESLNRYRAIANKTGHRAFLCADDYRWVTRAYPIYDWAHEDVWLAPEVFGWDYNEAYNVMAKAGVPIGQQRCAPPYGEQPLVGLWMYKLCWPQLWAKMCRRVPGASTAARYARTSLYGFGGLSEGKPDHLTWRDYVLNAINKLPVKERRTTAQALQQVLREHKRHTSEPLPEVEPHHASGLCWRSVAAVALRGDLKGTRVTQREIVKAQKYVESLRNSTRYHGDS